MCGCGAKHSCRAINHLHKKSAFRPCGRDLAEFFKSAVWPLYVQVDGLSMQSVGEIDGIQPATKPIGDCLAIARGDQPRVH